MGGGVLNVITKAVGIGGLGLVLYDAHMAGKMKGPAYEKEHKAHQLTEHYLEDTKIDSPSVVKNAMKKRIFQFHVDENFTGFFTTMHGYFKGFSSMLVDHAIPFVLATGALVGGKGLFSKFCGAGLLAYGGIYMLQEGFGIGKAKE